MTNRRIPLAFGTWVSGRPGGLRGLIASLCLSAAALLALTQAVSRHARSYNRQPIAKPDFRSQTGVESQRIAEARWKADVAEKLDEILSRISDEFSPLGHISE
jgi:hypothetical protein